MTANRTPADTRPHLGPGAHPGLRLLTTEEADGGGAAKLVFQGLQGGKPATFETGSFLSTTGDGSPHVHDICLSTAGGCTRHCTFCAASGPDPGFERLLEPREIVAQADQAVAWRNPDGRYGNVIGLMGNGEPPDNPATIPALHALMNRPYPVRRILVSTIGENTRGIDDLTRHFALTRQRCPVILHLSLHAVDPGKRRTLIPGRRDLADILRAVDAFADAAWDPDTNPHPVRINVVLIHSEKPPFNNATPADAERLAELLKSPSTASGGQGRRLLKLAAYNPIPGQPYTAPDEATRRAFVDRLIHLGVDDLYTFQGSGIEIDSVHGRGGFACGQLRATTAQLLRQQPDTTG